MKKFIKQLYLFLFILSIPIAISVVLYLIIDPFKVIYKYSEQINSTKNYQLASNRDFQSSQLFLWNYKKYDYNSFIFGNSRSFFYQVKTWNNFVHDNCFHFNASSESIYGINCKLKYLDENNVSINNALIVIDSSAINKTKNSTNHLFIKHPLFSKQSFIIFHLAMFKAFFPKAIFAFTDLYITDKKKAYMKKFGIMDNVWKHDMISNQLEYYAYDQQIKNNPVSYYADKLKLFYKRDTIQTFSKPAIYKPQKELLMSIQSILKKHKTNYKIIISPLYNQIKLNPKDLDYLKSLFGTENVFDFSGINSFTNDYRNYYEASHYRPPVCDSILNIVYKKDK